MKERRGEIRTSVLKDTASQGWSGDSPGNSINWLPGRKAVEALLGIVLTACKEGWMLRLSWEK